ncbi:MAG: hypothetical protein RSF40_02025 [Oscillospiraceae bacterium]
MQNQQSWKTEAMQLSLDGYNARQIAELLKDNEELCKAENPYEKVRQYIKKQRKIKGISRDCTGRQSTNLKDNVSFKNGITSFEIEQKILMGQEITPELIMKAKGLNTDEWKVISFTKNMWQQQTKNGDHMDLCQSKLSVKPKKDTIGIKYIVDYFKQNPIEPKPFNSAKYSPTGETLVIDIADPHFGLLSWEKETGQNFDIQIMKQRFIECVDDIASRITKGRFKKIIIAGLGDILHSDNNSQTTTKGTLQQVEDRLQKIIFFSLDVFTYMIDTLIQFAPIEYLYLAGNHDELMGFMFAFALQQAYKNNTNITFDIDPNPFKARLIGKTLLGFTHGEGKTANSGDWLVNDFRELFGQCCIAEVHQGHKHSQGLKERETGVLIRNITKLCNPSAWEHRMGYRSYTAMFCFVYDDKKLHRETWINYC